MGIYHLTARGVAKTPIVLDDDDRRFFLLLLGVTVDRHEWRCETFCLMNNHYHLIVEAPLWRISEGMHRMNGLYAQTFNHRYGRWGHLFGERFAAWVIETEEHLEAATLYVLENPVRAGVCKTPADWPWSGQRSR
jgi:putative transposase